MNCERNDQVRALKFGAIASVSLLMVICVLVGYLFMTAEVQVVEIKAEGIPATEQLHAFENIKTAIEENTFYGTIFQKPREWKDASEYVFINYTVRVSNNCLVPIDMIEVQIIPQSFDILQLPDLSVKQKVAEMFVQVSLTPASILKFMAMLSVSVKLTWAIANSYWPQTSHT